MSSLKLLKFKSDLIITFSIMKYFLLNNIRGLFKKLDKFSLDRDILFIDTPVSACPIVHDSRQNSNHVQHIF